MALVSDGYELHVTLMDSGLNTSKLSYQLDSIDAAAAATDSAAVLTALQAVTQAEVKGYSIAERFIEDNLVIPTQNIHVENIAAVVAQLSSSPLKNVTVKIPAPSPSIFISNNGAGSNTIDTLDTDLQAYIDLWRETGGVASISDGEYIEDGLSAILRGKRIHRQSSRG